MHDLFHETEIYPLGLEGLRNSTNKERQLKKKFEIFHEILKTVAVLSNCIFIRNIFNSWHKHDGMDVTVSPTPGINMTEWMSLLVQLLA